MNICSSCGNAVANDDRFCANCGAAVKQIATSVNDLPENESEEVRLACSFCGGTDLVGIGGEDGSTYACLTCGKIVRISTAITATMQKPAVATAPSVHLPPSGRLGRCKYCGEAVPIGVTPCPRCGHGLNWPKTNCQMNKSNPFLGVPNSGTRQYYVQNEETSSTGPILLGVLSLVCALLPVIGVPLAIIGLVVSGSKKNMIGGILCTIGLMLSIVNAISGGITGAQAEREYEARQRADQFIRELNRVFR